MEKSFIRNYKMLSTNIPKGATVIDCVKNKNFPLGSVLILFESTGRYALINDGVVSSVNQEEAKKYHAQFNFERFLTLNNIKMSELSKEFDIPYRTVQDWKNGKGHCPDYVLKMLKRIKEGE